MVSDRGVLNAGDEITVPAEEGANLIRLGRAERIPDEPELAVARPAETAVTRRRR